MSITQTAQSTDYSTTPQDIVNKLNRVTFFNVDNAGDVTVQGTLACRIKDTTGELAPKNATLSTTELFSGWSVPDPASTEENPLPDIVVSTGLTAAQKKGLKDGFKGIEKLLGLKHNELRYLPQDTSDVFA